MLVSFIGEFIGNLKMQEEEWLGYVWLKLPWEEKEQPLFFTAFMWERKDESKKGIIKWVEANQPDLAFVVVYSF